MTRKTHNAHAPQYHLDSDGRFIIENYNNATPFTNFFPGIAGMWGIPMWVFYVNRAQCISSFGIESKNNSIMEFQPANKAYRIASLQGFRTFIKIHTGNKTLFYEPFQNNFSNTLFDVTQKMAITAHDLTLEEVNHTLGITVTVNYFTVPDAPYAALVRNVSIKNTSKKTYRMEMIDGLPAIVPFGMNDRLLKDISRTLEAWVQVSNVKKKAPYFNLKVVVSDRPRVEHITAGNFYVAFDGAHTATKILDPIVEPACVFGTSYDFAIPEAFLEEKKFTAPTAQKTKNKMPCAMSFARFSIGPHKHKEVTSLTGHIHSCAELNKLVSRIMKDGYIAGKQEKNKEIIDGIQNYVCTKSASHAFDLYCGQTFLDNVLRGGLPVSLDTSNGKTAFNVYSRKHGDPERDYNHFVIDPTYLSQGNGNYRDVNQNRRCDAWFNPDVRDSNIINFLSLIQADGYNPLVVKGMQFCADDENRMRKIIAAGVHKDHRDIVEEIVTRNFTPGELMAVIDQKNIVLKILAKELLTRILQHCRKSEVAQHGEGFWSDHWTYNLDLLESYFALYPEDKKNVLLIKKVFSFYHNSFYVQPREKRYIMTEKGCRQYHSVLSAGKNIKVESDHKLRIHAGKGPVYHTTLLVKLLCIVANKIASLDPSGIGVEMEADKPNWYDALNGLPGLLGSSLSETLEIKRLCVFILDAFDELSMSDAKEIRVYAELSVFIKNMLEILRNEKDALSYWTSSNEAKEHYRESVRQGIDGQEKNIAVGDIKKLLVMAIAKADRAVKNAKNKEGLLATYFAHEVTSVEKLDTHNKDGIGHVWPLKFRKHGLPIFLEGFVHALRVEKDIKNARKLYTDVKKSALYDRKLKMYKVNADLSGESEDIGRARVFPAGWLENESIWSHMEYKFLLELLRTGLHKEFYENFKNILIPFQKPERYGRSTLENSSFIVSSAHEDSRLHGRGFVARLSGTTAELTHMWLLMNAGLKPFFVDTRGDLCLKLTPSLPGWLFTTQKTDLSFANRQGAWQTIALPKNIYAFKFLNSTLVVYHNPKRCDTFGTPRATIKEITLSYPDIKNNVTISTAVIPSPYAHDIRDGRVNRIDVHLA